MLLIGSRALQLRAPELVRRKPFDYDFIATRGEFEAFVEVKCPEKIEVISPTKVVAFVDGGIPCEFEFADAGSSGEQLIHLVKEDPETVKTVFGLVPSVDMLYTIKKSHRFLKDSPHFWKTLTDYHNMQKYGAKVRPWWEEMLRLREQETYTYAHPKLNVTKKEFFNHDDVGYAYDHDSIHRAIATLEQPAYRFFMKEDAEVMTSKKKFMMCSHEIQILSHVEEAGVLAIERSLVPYPGGMTVKQAWHFALSKLLTSISSGWWREWGYENAPEILTRYPEGYFDRFTTGLESGIVLPFKKD